MIILWLTGYTLFLNSIHQSNNTYDHKADAIIVLTGGASHRIQAGLSLWEQNRSDKLFITGVNAQVSKQAIKDMHQKDTALPECCITLDHNATTTIENAIQTQKWLSDQKPSSIILVTSTYHMPRAYLEFESKLRNIDIIPYYVHTDLYEKTDKRFWLLTLNEYHKYIYRYIILKYKQLAEKQ